MKTEHTPGPWHIELPSRWSGDSFGIYAGTEVKPNWICETHGIRFQNEPNAKLIAAAPELLIALELAKISLLALGMDAGHNHMVKIDAVLEKAKGKSQ